MSRIYVDNLMSCLTNAHWRWDRVSHLYTDPGPEHEAALHWFAYRLHLRREWFQDRGAHTPQGFGLPHYDLTPGKRAQAVHLGAVEHTREEMVARIRGYRAFQRGEIQAWEV